jgi:dTDP-4-dehydrorhamnose 3,5-epimerase
MELIKTAIPDVLILQPKVFTDDRGHFLEPFNLRLFESLGLPTHFVQDNQSCSSAGVLRGLHFQLPPHSQGKLVRVCRGAVLDVVVDLRKKSPAYGECLAVELTDKNFRMLWIPEGMAHGFLSLEDDTIFQYKCTDFYDKASEGSLRWNDPDLAIDWGLENPVLSEKDAQAPFFAHFDSPF